jgi:hypothetical protein
MTLGTNFGTGQSFRDARTDPEPVTRGELDDKLAHKGNRSTVENHDNRIEVLEAQVLEIRELLGL